MRRHAPPPPSSSSLLLGLSALVTATLTAAGAVFTLAAQETFRSSVELLTIDVQIPPSKNASLREFTAAEFEVTISGRKRPVASAAFLHRDDASVTRLFRDSAPATLPSASSDSIARQIDPPPTIC